MTTLLQFIARLAPFLYALIAAGIFFAIRGLAQGQRQRRMAAFGLEREAAANQMRRAATSILTLLMLAALVYVVKNIVVPAATGVAQTPPPTPEALAVEGAELTPTAPRLLFPTVTPTAGLPPAEAAEVEATPLENVEGCEIIGATITSPVPNDTVSGQVSVEGEVNVIDFAQYKFEVRGPSTGDAWAVVGTYYTAVSSGLLGVWDSTSLQPGSYTLRLVIHREDGTVIPPCEVPINVERSSVAG